jgi:hypothetical protein
MSPYEQLIIGIAAGLIFCAMLRWTPLWRDLLAAIAVAGLLDVLVNDQARRGLDLPSIAAGLPGEILGHPPFLSRRCNGLRQRLSGAPCLADAMTELTRMPGRHR